MSASFTRLADWWAGLSDRERWLLGILGALMAALVCWYGVLSPLNRLADSAQQRQAEAQAALGQVRALHAAIGRMEQMRAGGRAGSVEDHIRAAATPAGVVIAREQPEAGGTLSVWTEPVAARALFTWIGTLQREYGVDLRTLEVHRTEQPGLLDVRATFAGAAP